MHLELASCKSMKGVSIMNDQRIFDMELVKVESLEKAVRTPFYQTDSTGGSVWVINLVKPYQSITIITLMIYGLYCKARGYFIQRLIRRCLLQRGKL